MKTANISYLRDHLSEIVSTVREGESVLILDRKTPVARLEPYVDDTTNVPATLLELHRHGQLVLGRQTKGRKTLPPLVHTKDEADVVAMILDERESGR
jgi:antitoxin (DNA-binding transcriptional repressor) of toxin-antitoxin stability system